MDMGTALHDLIQKALGNVVTVLADWPCTFCGTVFGMQKKPSHCTKCGSAILIRKEHKVSLRRISGSIDDVYVIEIDGIEYAIVIDYKTTSASNLSKKKANPDVGYVEQISTYLRCVKKSHPEINWLGWALIYLDRANLTNFVIVFDHEEIPARVLKRYETDHLAILEGTVADDFAPIVKNRPCTPKNAPDHHKFCNFRNWCTQPKPEALTSVVNMVYTKIKPKLPLEQYLEEVKR